MSSTDTMVALARETLGSASADALHRDPATVQILELEVTNKVTPTDVLLRWAFEMSKNSPEIRDEFIASLIPDLERHAEKLMTRQSQGVRSADDLVQSMMGDIFPKLFTATFNNRPQFITYLKNKLKWKGLDKIKHERTLAQGGAHHIGTMSALEGRIQNEPSPLSALERSESLDHLAARVVELPDQWRKVFIDRLRGKSIRQLAQELTVTENAVEHMLRRARNALGKSL